MAFLFRNHFVIGSSITIVFIQDVTRREYEEYLVTTGGRLKEKSTEGLVQWSNVVEMSQDRRCGWTWSPML